jgi:predicted NBD/HSP70 family sugar kinase
MGVAAGVDLGGTAVNYTFIDGEGRWLIDGLCEHPARAKDGPDICLQQIADGLAFAAERAGIAIADVAIVGLDTPGPATAEGVISTRGATNFAQPAWWGFDVRGALEARIGLPVVYNNDGNAAALYAHRMFFGPLADERSSISAIVGTGLGGGVIEAGQVIAGAAGMAGELGHVHVPMDGLLADGQSIPECNCGFRGDVESIASLTGITRNLLPYWLTRYPEHPLATLPIQQAAKEVRTYGAQGDEMARHLFEQQAKAIGRLFTVCANYTDPAVYFLGGGVVEATPEFRDWFLARVHEHTSLREEQRSVAQLALVPDLDRAGARGSAFAALASLA